MNNKHLTAAYQSIIPLKRQLLDNPSVLELSEIAKLLLRSGCKNCQRFHPSEQGNHNAIQGEPLPTDERTALQ